MQAAVTTQLCHHTCHLPQGNGRATTPATSAAGPPMPATRVTDTSVHEPPTSRRQDGLDSRCKTTTKRSQPKRCATVRLFVHREEVPVDVWFAGVQVLVWFMGCLVASFHGWFVGAFVRAIVYVDLGDARPLLLSLCCTEKAPNAWLRSKRLAQETPTINPIGPTDTPHRPSTKHYRNGSPGNA